MENRKELEKRKFIDNAELIKNIVNTYNQLEVARKNYEFAEEELIDYYLYEIKANQAKLDYLIKKSKKNGVELDRIEKLELLNLEENRVG